MQVTASLLFFFVGVIAVTVGHLNTINDPVSEMKLNLKSFFHKEPKSRKMEEVEPYHFYNEVPQHSSQSKPKPIESSMSRPNSYKRLFASNEMMNFYIHFNKTLKKVDGHIVANNEALYLRFIAWERDLNTKHDMKVNEAVKEGNDRKELEECVVKKSGVLRHKLYSEWQRIDTCRSEATKTHRKILSDIGKTYSETLNRCSQREKNWGREVYLCQENDVCIQRANESLEMEFNSTKKEGERVIKQIEEGTEKHTVLLNYCYQDFFNELKYYENAFLFVIQECSDLLKDSEGDEYTRRKRSIDFSKIFKQPFNQSMLESEFQAESDPESESETDTLPH